MAIAYVATSRRDCCRANFLVLRLLESSCSLRSDAHEPHMQSCAAGVIVGTVDLRTVSIAVEKGCLMSAGATLIWEVAPVQRESVGCGSGVRCVGLTVPDLGGRNGMYLSFGIKYGSS